MKIGLCQMLVQESKTENLKRAYELVEKAAKQGAEVIVLPEMFNCPYSNQYFIDYAESQGGRTYTELSSWASQFGVLLIGGSIPEQDGDHIYNTAFIFDQDGKCIGKHRKAHLFDIDIPGGIRFKESDTLTPGDRATIIDTDYGRMGVAICYDMRFPEFFRHMALEGAEIIVVPAAFNMTTGPAHWELTARARALDNQVFMALCSPARDETGTYVAYGHSMVAGPWGDVIACLNEEEGVLIAQVDLEKCKAVKNNLPLLKHRRPDLYGHKQR